MSPERFPGWIAGLADRHGGPLAVEAAPDVVLFRAADGAAAACHPPFPPLAPGEPGADPPPGTVRAVVRQAHRIAAHATADRTVGVLLVRLGGYAAGVFTGDPPRLADSKVGSRLVHGRSAAGGRSQHRFARRREKQASRGAGARRRTPRSGCSAGIRGELDAVVLGGDRRAMAGLREDPRLQAVLRRGGGPVPHRARSPAGRAQGHPAAVPRHPRPAHRDQPGWTGLSWPCSANSVAGTT